VQLRTRVAVLLAVASIAAACFATCGRVSAPPSDLGTTETTEATDVAVRRVRPRRRRTARRPASTDQAPLDLNGSARALERGANDNVIFTYGALARGAAAPTGSAEAPPTGRVRVLMLKDGRPFEGGHVCFFRQESFVEPGPWDGTSSSDGAYFALPKYTSMWPHFDPVLGSGAPVSNFEAVRGPRRPLARAVRAPRNERDSAGVATPRQRSGRG